jgi:hypothetical protein
MPSRLIPYGTICSEFDKNELRRFFVDNNYVKADVYKTLSRIYKFSKIYDIGVHTYTKEDLDVLKNKLDNRQKQLKYKSMIDLSLYEIFAPDAKTAKFHYEAMVKKKTKVMVDMGSVPNVSYRKGSSLAYQISVHGEEEGAKRYESSIKKQKKSSVRCVEYWMTKGYSEEEAKDKVSFAQNTFSLDICVEKHGVIEGTRIWQERQDKWQATLNAKPQNEIDEMNRKKSSGIRAYGYGEEFVGPGIFYSILLPDSTIKFGITNKNSVDGRYFKYQLKNCTVFIEEKNMGIGAPILESIIKTSLSSNVIPKWEQKYSHFGQTETVKMSIEDYMVVYKESKERLNELISNTAQFCQS